MNLTIYRASAGSGKTYTLTGEYIKLLLKGYDNYHRRILAVTFTNKATAEMKNRIVRDLYNLANRETDKKYIGKIAEETQIPEDLLPALASKILANLLHDYSHFSVLTIDSFFQKVIRSFARETGLYAGYDIDLDQQSALEEATNLMLNDVDNNEYLKDWLVEWAKRKIEDGKSWNFKSDVLRLGSEIFSEELQNLDPELLTKTTDKKSLEIFRVKLKNLKSDYIDYLQSCGQIAMDIFDSYGLTVDSFSQKGKGVGGYFYKWSQRQETEVKSYVAQALNGVEKSWYTKTSPHKNAITNAYYDGLLGELLKNMTDYQIQRAREIDTANVILKQINVLGVLSDLMNNVSKYARDQNLFLLSEASGFIKKIIADADAPFIYERVGNFYNHFMIDEFQDTSFVQWNNFRPLIDNSIASGHSNWIVGDVKQSIYRWRNTDWKILSEEVEKELGPQKVHVERLDKNWRSSREIIGFNNSFFREAVEHMRVAFLHDEADIADIKYLHGLTVEITKAYSDFYQHLPENYEKTTGFVHLEMISEDDDETWNEKVLQELPHRIERLQDLGYRLSDIAIIVRRNEDAQTIADKMLEYRQANPHSKYRYDVLSNDSLLINNSPVVKWLVAAMRYIVEPDDIINHAYLQHEYGKNLKLETINLKLETVFELSERLINQFNLYENAGQAPFLQAFQDILLQYTHRESSDIRSFLNWWDVEKSKKNVSMPDNQDAIQLITIHKSKGLEFDAVIIPFCDWELCKAGRMLWCHPTEEPFSDMKLLPLKFETELRKTIFVNDYLREKMLSYIDNLNLLYVAFTRAAKALFISMPQPQKDIFINVSNLISRVFNHPLSYPTLPYDDDIDLHKNWNDKTMIFRLGELTVKESKKEKSSSEHFQFSTQNFIQDNFQFSIPHIPRNSARFTADGAQIDKGRLLHDIFRKIVTLADLEHCLNAIIIEGKLPEAERIHIINMVHQALENPIVNRWFASDVNVKTEAEILLPNGSIARPDRIVFDNEQTLVIDYKFGNEMMKKDRQQVLQYMKYLHRMGYKSVRGFLWYVMVNEVLEVIES